MDLKKVFDEFQPIETGKMRLRKLRSEDAPDLLRYYLNEEVYRYLNWNGPETLEQSHEYRLQCA